MISNNPFSNNRAEYMKDLWKYYVPVTEINFSSNQPMYIEGGRGTGKTTLFLCNSWREKYAKNKSNGENGIQEILDEKQIGIYYKVDPTFVTAMNGKNKDDNFWQTVFCTYISIEIIKELFYLFLKMTEHGLLLKDDVKKITACYMKSVRDKEADTSLDIADILLDCNSVLDEIENTMNTIEMLEIQYRTTNPGTIVNQIIDVMALIDELKDITVKVYIDECESLLEWQQRVINTLIKKSNSKVVYNIGAKPKGIRTFETIIPNEPLQKTHDYKYYNLDIIITDNYAIILNEICKKRLEMFKETYYPGSDFSCDIEYYLDNYKIETELQRYEDKGKTGYHDMLETLIRQECNEDKYIQVLCNTKSVLHSRMHLALLLRAPAYKPSVQELYTCYNAYLQNSDSAESRKYREWLHNTQNGLMFLLAKDYRMHKWYYGFNMYQQLSSGIIRLFLELCEQAFVFAIQKGFDWNNATMISPEIQTRAATYVSKKQIMEIDAFSEYGKQMQVFTLSLGELFRELHRNDNLTLGEPEPNHFSANLLELGVEEQKSLYYAIRCSVLQEIPQTKEKEVIHTNTVDYHLNKIYAPYFEISCKKNRKLDLESDVIRGLLSADSEIAKETVKRFLGKYWKNKRVVMTETGTGNENIYEQLTILS